MGNKNSVNLAQTLAGLRERIRQRVEGRLPGVPDFRPAALGGLEKHQERAENWGSLVGTVNPRPAGLHNAVVQWVKRILARSLRWYSYPQREFNQAVLDALVETREVFADQNRNLLVLAQLAEDSRQSAQEALAELARFWEAVQNWRQEVRDQGRSLDGRIMANVTRLDAAITELQQEYREQYHALDGHLAKNVERLDRALNDIQQAFWKDFAAYGEQHLALHEAAGTRIEEELRVLRQRVRSLAAPAAAAGLAAAASGSAESAAPAAFDYLQFERRFRGSEEEIRGRQAAYLPHFRQRSPVLDIACGRGEYLRLLKENGIEARGVDLDPEMVARCRDQGLDVACGDAFAYLESRADASLGGIFSAQFIEHLSTPQYVRLIELACRKLRSGGALLLETQNPECLAIFSQSFFVDPTHVRPVPPSQLRFWMEEAGFHSLDTLYSSPVSPHLPALPLLEAADRNADAERWNQEAMRFNQTYFGYQDYAVLGIKP